MATKPKPRPIPTWIIERVQEARDLFGVGGPEWSITLKLTDRPGGHEADGYTTTDPVYLNATIELWTGLQDDQNGREAVYHEVLHVAHSEIWRIITDKGETDDYRAAVERFVTRVTRSLISQIKDLPNDESDA